MGGAQDIQQMRPHGALRAGQQALQWGEPTP
jgi:hypothetical protein